MPTGYTASIEDGKITSGKDFLMLCARAFGACIEMRDEPLISPIPESFKPSEYYKTKIAEAEKNIKKYSSLSIVEAQRMIDEEYQRNQKIYAKELEKQKQIRQRYKLVEDEVKQWQPPTSEHTGLKEFAIKQIAISCDSEDSLDIWNAERQEPKATPGEWLKARVKHCQEDLDRYKKSWQAEIEKTNKRNEWLIKLRESLS